ncbi:MAG: phosphoribosyltransferase [Candidatus Omnitrophica bacterium]|nr:phosphoribosyltransferase [Candidatus Omnitrophota bacterium]
MKKISFSEISKGIKSFDFPEVDFIVGIGKGGIPPAALIAYKLQKSLSVIFVNYRDDKNEPCRKNALVTGKVRVPAGVKRILLIDDVGVTGETFRAVKRLLGKYKVSTFALKGFADHVLFPELHECVIWPWKSINPG